MSEHATIGHIGYFVCCSLFILRVLYSLSVIVKVLTILRKCNGMVFPSYYTLWNRYGKIPLLLLACGIMAKNRLSPRYEL